VSGLDHPGKTRSRGQSGETTCTVSLLSPFSAFDRSTDSRNQSPFLLTSCPRCLTSGHELRACSYKAERTYLLCMNVGESIVMFVEDEWLLDLC
jgi:hypothetical protein